MNNGERGEAWRRRLGDHDPQLFDKHGADRMWLTIKGVEEEMDQGSGNDEDNPGEQKSFNTLRPAQKFTLIRKVIKKPLNFYYSKGGSVEILIFADKADEIMKITEIGDFKVTIEKHSFKNYIKGTIKHPVISKSSKEEIIEGLSNSKVVDVYVKQTPARNKDGKVIRDNDGNVQLVPTDVAEVKFELENIPPQVELFGLILEVYPYEAEAVQCRTCFLFSHTSKWCNNKDTPVCYWCSQNTHTRKGERCTNEPHCRNCPTGQNKHANISKDCPMRKVEKEIQNIKIGNKCSYYEAKNIYKGKINSYAKPTRAIHSYAAVTDADRNEKEKRASEKIWQERLEENNKQWGEKMKRVEDRFNNKLIEINQMIKQTVEAAVQAMLNQIMPQMFQTIPPLPTMFSPQMIPHHMSSQSREYRDHMQKSLSNVNFLSDAAKEDEQLPHELHDDSIDVYQSDETRSARRRSNPGDSPPNKVQKQSPESTDPGGPGGHQNRKKR